MYRQMAWCRSGNRTPGPGTGNPPQRLKVGPGSRLKFKSGTPGLPPKFKSGTPGPPSKFKSGNLIIIFISSLLDLISSRQIYV